MIIKNGLEINRKWLYKVTAMAHELELNREWLCKDDSDEPYAEKNFVISQEWFLSIFNELFGEQDINIFLDCYVPEEDGEKLYQRAKLECEIIEEFISPLN